MQYGLIQGYAYFLVYGLSMMAAGYVTDKYRLNRVWVVAIGSGLTGAALVIEVRYLKRHFLPQQSPWLCIRTMAFDIDHRVSGHMSGTACELSP